MYTWCYFRNNKCVEAIPETKSTPLAPMEVIQLKANGIIRFLCDIPDDFNPTGKTMEELKEYIR